MTKKELIDSISHLPDDTEVVVGCDSYSWPLNYVSTDMIYIPANEYIGTIYSKSWTSDEADFEEKEWEEFKQKNKSCIHLWFAT